MPSISKARLTELFTQTDAPSTQPSVKTATPKTQPKEFQDHFRWSNYWMKAVVTDPQPTAHIGTELGLSLKHFALGIWDRLADMVAAARGIFNLVETSQRPQ